MIRSRVVLLLLTILAMTVPSVLPHREGPAFIMVGSGSGGLRLFVLQDGRALLIYGALLGIDVKPGVFHIDELYAGLYGQLMDPDACWRDISRPYDSVLLEFEDGSREEYCTHDTVLTTRVLTRACENLMEDNRQAGGGVYERECEALTGQSP